MLREASRVLHIAPEKPLGDFIRKRPGVEYIAGDKRASAHDYPESVLNVDLCDLEYPDNHFDLIVANHVLEHIPDDHAAMSEIFRTLKPGAAALLQVPYSEKLDASLENPDVAVAGNPAALEEWFGQYDHIRIYSRDDYVQRLGNAGLRVEATGIAAITGSAALASAVDPEETLFVCRKPV